MLEPLEWKLIPSLGGPEDPKVRENRLRRMAACQGLRLQKCRCRDPRVFEYGTYQLLDPLRNWIVYHERSYGFGATLDQIEEVLKTGIQGSYPEK